MYYILYICDMPGFKSQISLHGVKLNGNVFDVVVKKVLFSKSKIILLIRRGA